MFTDLAQKFSIILVVKTENPRGTTCLSVKLDIIGTIFLNLVKLKFLHVVKKMTKPYDPLFRNTRENRDNTREKIFEIYIVPYL